MRESVLGSREDTIHLVRTFQIDEVFVAYAPSWQQRLAQELAAEQPEVRVQIVPTAYEALMRVDRVSSIGDVAVLRLNTDVGCLFDLFKRGVDILSALLGSIVLSPAALLVALLIRVTSRGPVIFAQERVGKGGRPFVLYKFRTMVHGAEAQTGPVLSNGRRDSRVTPVGRLLRATRLDELPQLWNVLLGDMSLVGPRPERPHFVRRFEREIPSYTQRHLVRPGITGLAQVHGNYHTDARDKLRFDLIYVSHRCLLLDLKVIARTVQVVLSSRGS
jgi:exopolysaccharide biosynthesis polyprenyl glycosylphosphotransferase